MARDFLARLARGERPFEKKTAVLTFGEYLDTIYTAHLSTLRTGKRTLNDLRTEFSFLLKTKLDAIRLSDLLSWQANKKTSVKSATINRYTAPLKAALNHAVALSLIEKNPLDRLRSLKADDSTIVERYLTNDEYNRLLAALDAPGIPLFMRPLVILATNTGIRKGGLLALTWGDIDLNGGNIIVRAESSKSGKQINLPLNTTAASALAAWKLANGSPAPEELVFKGVRSGEKMEHFNCAWYRLLKAAGIENFRFHDTRHSYASRLVMNGVDLPTVQRLCGHSSISMTGRYAHLAPEGLRKAVETLDVFHRESLQAAKEA
jgi:integrase